jgi:hypothetical protein
LPKRDHSRGLALRGRPGLHRLLGTDLRKELRRLARGPHNLRAAVAYVTSDLDVQFGEGDTLIVDASDAMIAGGQTSASVLLEAFERGAALYCLPSLHAKIFLFGQTAVIGSANLSGSTLIEAGLATRDHVIVAGISSMIDEMTRHASRIDESFLCRISRITVRRPMGRGLREGERRTRRISERGNRTWLVAVAELKDDAFPEEQRACDRGLREAEKRVQKQRSTVGWLRFTGKSRFRHEARAGDSVIQIYTQLGRKRPQVIRHSPILKVQREPNCTRLYVESFADEERRQLSWTTFLAVASKAGWRAPAKGSVRPVPDDVAREMFKLWPN